jgi:hypothetical protein
MKMATNQKKQAIEMFLSWVRVFLAAMIAQYLAGYDNPQMLFNAGISAVLPILLRYIDPHDRTYGKGSQRS